MVIKYLKVTRKLMDIAFCIHAYHELHITTSKILINCWKKDFFLFLTATYFTEQLLGAKNLYI